MSFTTFFQHSHTSLLPLPPVREKNSRIPDAPNPETSADILQRGLKTALTLLHQPEVMISLNPLVVHYSCVPPTAEMQERLVEVERLAHEFNVALANPPSCSSFEDSKNGEFVHYEITDRFNFLFGSVSKLMVYRACFRPLYVRGTGLGGDGSQSIGIETISDPGSGVALLGKWVLSVDEQRPGYIVLTETVKVHCNVFVSWYIKGQLEGAHEQIHKEFGRRFVEKMVDEDPSVPPSVRAKQRQSMNRTSMGGDIAPVGRVNSGNSIKEGMKMRIEVGRSKKEEKNDPVTEES
ncbi:hypothetical protein H2198_003694 [Neophaeococcomyces mojaviensis]|uniref:Uncharacterized protein n=1 Tax=Neophaeococcomyces mojaviensis TaxID=3383035 RepID=A0ACC3AAN7_9EURO|nr:hypothetical protein H2198_003694 [Knufia sp. JES_112]